MSALDNLISTFTAQSNTALGQTGDAPWQNELLESVNPEKVRKRNIAQALLKASQALATTPGNFLQGVSAAASSGADSYITDRDNAEQERLKTLQLVQMARQKDQDRRLSLLMDAIGVQQKQDDTLYSRGRDTKSDERQAKADARAERESQARTNYYNRRGVTAPGAVGLSEAQVQTNRRAARKEFITERDNLNESLKSGEITPEDMSQQLEEKQIEIERYYGVSLDGADATDVQTPASGKTDQIIPKNNSPTVMNPQVQPGSDGILSVPPPVESRIVGQVYSTPKGRFVWTGTGWKAAQ